MQCRSAMNVGLDPLMGLVDVGERRCGHDQLLGFPSRGNEEGAWAWLACVVKGR